MLEKVSNKRIIFGWTHSHLLGDLWLKPRKETVLMYHRIIDPTTSPFPLESGMYVRPKVFEMQLKYLKNKMRVVSLADYIKNIRVAKKEKLVALTFDDAWIDFKENAYPLLEKYKLEACLFIPTKFIGTNRLFWTDLIANLLGKLEKHPEKLLLIQKKLIDVGFAETIVDLVNMDLPGSENLSMLINYLKKLSLDDRKVLIEKADEIIKEAFEERFERQFLTWDELKELSKSELITFGQHSHSHNISTEISTSHFNEDVETATQTLISHDIPVNKIFCYPNEARNLETDRVLKDLGFEVVLGRYGTSEINYLKNLIPAIDRIGIHDDISANENLFKLRLKGL